MGVAGRFVADGASVEVAGTVVVLAVVAFAGMCGANRVVTFGAGRGVCQAVLVVADAAGREIGVASPAVAVCAVREVIIAERVAAVSTRRGMLLAEVIPAVGTCLGVVWAEFVTAGGTGGCVFRPERVITDHTVRRMLVTVPAVTIGTRDAMIGTDVFGTGRTRPSVGITDRRVVNYTHPGMIRAGVIPTYLARSEVLDDMVAVAVLAVASVLLAE